jgi:tRNA-2-methylthio-N6-dimethylallyladenosine synthase
LFERKIWETDGRSRPEEIYHTGFYGDKNHAYVVISEGCSNFCSYCVVPYVRGPLRHRKLKDILTEIKQALGQGITKVTLLGQNVNAYRDGRVSFANLLERVNALSGLKEFDFFTAHPKDAGTDLFRAIRDLEKSARRLHLPLQSGSDRILKLMNRGYSAKDYLVLIDSYRKIVKDGRLTTDIIVGFPTETEREFEETCALLKKSRFNSAYIFKYSSRPGTEAAKIIGQLEPAEKEKRHKKILDLQRGISKQLKE